MIRDGKQLVFEIAVALIALAVISGTAYAYCNGLVQSDPDQFKPTVKIDLTQLKNINIQIQGE
jgi:hypothetical protein